MATAEATRPAYTLFYWPIPGRGIFIRSLLAYADVQYDEAPVEEIVRIKSLPFSEQPIPLRGPPFLVDHMSNQALSQMTAVAHYVAMKHNLVPQGDLMKQSLALKVLCDCNDVLGELWRANGSQKLQGEWVLWDQAAWNEFREGAFVDWLKQFEALALKFGCTLDAGFLLGTPNATLADLSAWSLWVTMERCLPALSKVINENAPTVMAICRRLEKDKSELRALQESDSKKWGELYCGGLIEKSIREVIAGGVDGHFHNTPA